VRRAAQPGAALLLADFWTNPAHTEPLQAALMAGEFAAHIRPGMSTAWTRPGTGWTTPGGLSNREPFWVLIQPTAPPENTPA
jgi:hypothetical protein